MTFSRTAAGLGNYRHFHQADIIVYIEGKADDNSGGSNAPVSDILFYHAIFNNIAPDIKFKIKCVGNRDSALEYAQKIETHHISGGLVIVDRDLHGINHSVRPLDCLMLTYGYSWENDLWTTNLSMKLADDIAHAPTDELKEKIINTTRRLAFLSALDAAMQLYSEALLKKASAQGGISCDFDKKYPISIKEIKRLLSKYRTSTAATCSVCKQITNQALKLQPTQHIQGHLWANIMYGLISRWYRTKTSDTPPTKKILLNLALSRLSTNINQSLTTEALEHYKTSLAAKIKYSISNT